MNDAVKETAKGKAGPTERRRQLIVWSILGGSLLLGLAIGLFGSGRNTTAFLDDNPLSPVIVALLIALSLWASIFYWRQIDEAARAAHEKAFLWGGSIGMLFAVWLMLCITSIDRHWLNGVAQRWAEQAPWDVVFMSGAAVALGFTAIGYCVAWLWFWWRVR